MAVGFLGGCSPAQRTTTHSASDFGVMENRGAHPAKNECMSIAAENGSQPSQSSDAVPTTSEIDPNEIPSTRD